MSGMKSLAKDTAVYGLSSIVGRFLNWCLVPLYTHVFAQAEYGVVTYLYSLVALLLIILTYGLETGFFRFANHEKYKDPMRVYTTGLMSFCHFGMDISRSHFIGSRFVGRSPLCDDACRYIGHRCVYLFAVCLPAL